MKLKGKSMIFWRVKSLDTILATAEKKALNRTLGVWQLTLLGVGAIIGTGIFVLTAEAAQKAGPGMMFAFIIAGFVWGCSAMLFRAFFDGTGFGFCLYLLLCCTR